MKKLKLSVEMGQDQSAQPPPQRELSVKNSHDET